MSYIQPVRKGVIAVGALGALALGGSALANAATSKNDGNARSGTPPAQGYGAPGQGNAGPGQGQGRAPGGGRPDPTKPGGHVGRNGKTEAALPSDTAARVKAAAEAKVPGGTVERVETDVDHGSPYEAHVRKADGTELEVLIGEDFQVTAVNTMQAR